MQKNTLVIKLIKHEKNRKGLNKIIVVTNRVSPGFIYEKLGTISIIGKKKIFAIKLNRLAF
jgi:hypothetical protein